MTTLFDTAQKLLPISVDATGEEVFRRFKEEPDTLAICVADGAARPVGLIERNAFMILMGGQYGHALWAKRAVSTFMMREPLMADGQVTVAEFCGQVLQESPSDLLHGFVITRDGCYAGVGTMLALLQASASMAAQASSQAQEALAARSRFLAVMSHEIRTPLNGVLAVAEIARRRSTQPELVPLLNTILESGAVLGRLLNDALDLSRAEASGLELDQRPLRPRVLAEEVRNLWSAQAEMKGLELCVEYDGDPEIWARGDSVRLSQILNNLVSNALKFTRTGTISVRVRAAQEVETVSLMVSVADQGSGVPEDLREAIFAPFQQTEEGVRKGGAGLGLAVCRQLVDRMGGSIRVTDNPGGGAIFTFEARLDAASAPSTTESASHEDLASGGQVAHILIADDNPTNLLVARNLCEILGYTSECVEDGTQAVEAASSGRFDLVLMDIQMPGMDGVRATREIRTLRSNASRVPIIALTANADPSDAAFYRRSGMNGVVAKPINPQQLFEAIRAVLAEGEMEARLTA